MRRLRRRWRPDVSTAYDIATAAAERELSFPHTAEFPPADSALIEHRGAGRFRVTATLSAEDGLDRRHTVPWMVELHRGDYRWVIDTVSVESPADGRRAQ